MINIIKIIFKKIIYSFTIIYGFNYLLASTDFYIAINIFNIIIISILNFFGLFILVILKLLI